MMLRTHNKNNQPRPWSWPNHSDIDCPQTPTWMKLRKNKQPRIQTLPPAKIELFSVYVSFSSDKHGVRGSVSHLLWIRGGRRPRCAHRPPSFLQEGGGAPLGHGCPQSPLRRSFWGVGSWVEDDFVKMCDTNEMLLVTSRPAIEEMDNQMQTVCETVPPTPYLFALVMRVETQSD